MLPIFISFFLLIVVLSSLTTVPFSIAALVVATVLFKKFWVFFAAFLLGLLLDLFGLRPLGYTSLMLVVFMFIIGLYERKFEAQTITFVFVATFLGSLVYLNIFGYQQILLQSLLNSSFAILLFKVLYFGKLRKLSEPD